MPCVLVGLQVRRKSDFTLVMRARKAVVTELVLNGYIVMSQGGIISLSVRAVALMDDDRQMDWLVDQGHDLKLLDALVMLSRKDRLSWMTKHCVV